VFAFVRAALKKLDEDRIIADVDLGETFVRREVCVMKKSTVWHRYGLEAVADTSEMLQFMVRFKIDGGQSILTEIQFYEMRAVGHVQRGEFIADAVEMCELGVVRQIDRGEVIDIAVEPAEILVPGDVQFVEVGHAAVEICEIRERMYVECVEFCAGAVESGE